MKPVRISAILAASLLAWAVAATAQTRIPGPAGLGRVVRPLDARARSLGGTAVTLHRDNLSTVNPASLGRLLSPGVWITLMPTSRSVEGQAIDGDVTTTDFPLGRVAAQLSSRWAASLAFGGYLDQDWGVQFTDTVELESGDIGYDESRVSDGGVSQFRLDIGGKMTDRFSIGGSAVLYAGEARRSIERVFERGSGLQTYRANTTTEYHGWGLAAGFELGVGANLFLGLDASWSPSGLEARDSDRDEAVDIELPVAVDFGASWRASPDVILVTSAGWAGWSAADDELRAAGRGGSVDSWRVTTGVELRLLARESDALFARFGGRLERQPFRLSGGAPTEWALSAGVGLRMAGGRGRLDTAFEYARGGGIETYGVKESYTRLTLTLAVFD